MIKKNSRDFRINRRLKNKETISKYKKFKIQKKDNNDFRVNKRLRKEKRNNSLENRKKRTIKRDNQDSKSNERMNLFFLEPFFCL